ncbi:MAG: FtsX-like permease family protein, partial [Bacillota bacterium]
MRAIWQKARADLWGRRWQSLLILVTIGAASGLLYLGLLTFTTLSGPLEQLIDRTRGPHAYFIITGEAGVEGFAARIAADPAVIQSELRPVYDAELLFPGRDENGEVLLQPAGPGPAAMMDHLIVAGRGLQPGREGEAVLGVSLARHFGIAVGDQIRPTLPGGPQPLTVVGLSTDSLWCAYPTCSPQNLYVLPETFQRLTAGLSEPRYLLGVRLADPAAADAFVSRAVKEAGPVQIMTALSWLTMRTGTQLLHGLTSSSLLIFALTAIAAAALITINLVGGAVLAQFREIAVLKALGFTAWQVQALYGLQNLLLGLLGGAAGVAAGQLAAGWMLVPLAENMGNPSILQFRPGLGALVVGLIALLALGVGLLAAWPAVRLRPATALRDGFAAARARTPWPVRLLGALRAPAPVILGVKDVTARPGRALLTTLSLTLCILTISISAGVGQFSRQLASDLDLLGMPYDLMVVVKEPYTAAEAEAIARSLPEVEAVARRTQLGVMATEQEAAFRLEAVDGDWRSIPWQLIEGRLPEGEGEIMLATGLLRQLGVAVGDPLPLRVAGQSVTWRVVGAYRNPMELGRIGLTTAGTLRQAVPEVRLSGLLVRVREGTDPAVVRQALLERSGYRVAVSLMRTFIAGGFMQDLLEQVNLLALLMAVIAALSMLNTALLTAREQVREVGIRKALGMTPAQILAAVGAGGAWLGLIGALVGVPGGLWLHGLMTELMTRQLTYGQVILERSPLMVALLLLG